MQIFKNRTNEHLASIIKDGGLAVLRTDTIYGIVARADSEASVERIYALKGRDYNKPLIVLIADPAMLHNQPDKAHQAFIEKVWPGPVSVIMDSPDAPEWLRRGGETVAYRLPADPELRKLISQTGPLVAPSANKQGGDPAESIEEAVVYFGDDVDAYVDSGTVLAGAPPSQLYAISDDAIERLR